MADTDGLLSEKDVQRITQTLGAVRTLRGHYASGADGQRLMQEFLTTLRAGNSLICKNVADAIDCANRMKGVQEAPHPSTTKAA